MQGDPAVLRLPQDYKLSVSGNQRVAAVSTAAVAVQAEQAEFQAAAAKISFATHYTFKQVCLVFQKANQFSQPNRICEA